MRKMILLFAVLAMMGALVGCSQGETSEPVTDPPKNESGVGADAGGSKPMEADVKPTPQ